MLNGTISLPQMHDKIPLAVIVPRAGLINRDGKEIQNNSSLNTPIYQEWANFLSSKNIASFYYDKRILSRYGLDPTTVSQQDQIKDVLSAVYFMKKRSEIDTNKIFLIGHGEGGNIVSIAANKIKNIAGSIMINSLSFAIDSLIIEKYTAYADNSSQLGMEMEKIFSALRNDLLPGDTLILGNGLTYWREWIWMTENADSIFHSLKLPCLILHSINHDFFPSFTLEKNISNWEKIASQSERIMLQKYQNVTFNLRTIVKNRLALNIMQEMSSWMLKN